MTNRNSAPHVSQASRAPWIYRRRRLFGVLVVTGLLAAASGFAASIKIEVKVPLIVPIFAAVSLVVLMDRTWQSFRTSQRAGAGPARPSVRWAVTGGVEDLIGREERDAILSFLGERYSTEHLDEDEYGRRHTMVLQARRRGELGPALEGLSWS